MKQILFTGILLPVLLISQTLFSQSDYQYSIDLTKLSNDELTVNLRPPASKQPTVVFSFPKIIPCTYSIADYGQFIKNVKAYDKAGKALPVKKLNVNQWQISNALKLGNISYTVSDVYDTEEKHKIYPMAATNFEEGKNFVFNLPGIIGFFEKQRSLPFVINFVKPVALYASTSLQPVTTSPTTDVFSAQNIDELYDHPIMYSVPDTTTVTVGNCKVLVSVYSPNKKITSKVVAGWMKDLLDAARKYLGGKLPADHYSFLYYFRDSAIKHSSPYMGALEHTTSSFFYMEERPAEMLKRTIVDVSSHEFFHIITPLTIASKEVKQFNFHEPVLSKHLWLYEGSTEYAAHHVQVKYGLKTVPEFLSKLSSKIKRSMNGFYNDSLAFTELSKYADSKYSREYGNVYEKGALIAAALDIYLLHLSNGKYGFSNLTRDLGIRFGKTRYFNDDELFDEIAELTYPEVKDFLQTYVAGPNPIPYEYFFGLAGIQYTPREEKNLATFGSVVLYPLNGVVTIYFESDTSDSELLPHKRNAFRKAIGFVEKDEVYAINNVPITVKDFWLVGPHIRETVEEGQPLTFKVGRLNDKGGRDTLTLSAPAVKVPHIFTHELKLMKNLSPQLQRVQQAWLSVNEPIALNASAHETFTIKGKLTEVKEPQKIVLKYRRGEKNIFDTTRVINGAFSFSGKVQHPVRASLILIPLQPGKVVFTGQELQDREGTQDLFVEQGTITVSGRKNLKDALIQGGKTQREYLQLKKQLKLVQDQQDKVSLKWEQLLRQKTAAAEKKFGSALTTDQMKETTAAALQEMPEGSSSEALRAKIAKVEHDYIRQHPDSYVSFDLVRSYVKTGIDAKTFELLYNSLSRRLLDTKEARRWPVRYLSYRWGAFSLDKLKSTYAYLDNKYKNTSLAAEAGEMANLIRQRISVLEATAAGTSATPIVKNDIHGNPVNWEGYKGKYVLLDFWASWCAPCRASHAHLKELYAKYKDKGFDILSIAYERGDRLDLMEKTWKAAIKKDGLPWTQVLNDIDLKKFDAFEAYGVVGGGLKILLDKDGKIVDRYDGFYAELDKKLKEVFGF
jgi:predicted metalloprotease with PDZ domain/thiol-disulfide isomerase/thioredoxin